MESGGLPSWITYPGQDWVKISATQAGLDPAAFAEFLRGREIGGASFFGEDHSGGRWGAVFTRGGYLVESWGDPTYRFQTASTGKAFAWLLVGLAAADGLIDPDEPIRHSWTGAGQLSHPHKHLDQGHHTTLTWRHLLGSRTEPVHYGGFPVELGNRWAARQTGIRDHELTDGVAEWAHWTGDPFYDNYAHAEPGTVAIYASGGYWRLAQALTAVWKRDLKTVLDERLFSVIGVPPERWDWLIGDDVRRDRYFYPGMPDTFTYLDPPYEIEGAPVRSGPGWVVISAEDLARFGHLVATGGIWQGTRLIGAEWVRGHGGGNESGVSGESTYYTATAVVTTKGLHPKPVWHNVTTESLLPPECFVGDVDLTRA